MKTLLHLAMLAALSCTPAVHAGSLIDVGVVDRDTGATLPAYPRDGKYYVIGVPGHRYGVRLVNRTGARVLAVLAVDGVNAVSGETANPDQSGYVLDPYQSTEIDGWRKSMNEVAQFNFTALPNSYAVRTGRPDNVGVIGVAVFREKPLLWREGRVLEKISADAPLADRYTPPPAAAAQAASRPAMPAQAAEVGSMAKSTAAPAGSLARADESANAMRREAKSEESLGTGHGAREASNVSYTKFERASAHPDEIVSVWYDSYRNLVARGVVPPPPAPPQRDPQPFPQTFVPDPAG
ncbi:MAG: hypothetical protein E6K53_02660 [Gammaproteobacteria bacterium]|nr:MAG: hypothetical protein E6K53_02660 [Gammaproteobacteria bacterium]